MEYPPEFDKVWAMLPGRGVNNPKKAAFKAWSKRLKEGVKPADLERAAGGYYLYCRQKGILGTEFVMLGSTFFGPNERFEPFLKGGDSHTAGNNPLPGRAVTEPPEPRIDARPFIRELLEGLAGAKKSPLCVHERAK